jgi:hypothetical protein
MEDALRVAAAQESNSKSLREYPNVVGTATGPRRRKGRYTSQVCVQVFVSKKYPLAELPKAARIPAHVPGPDGVPVPTDVVEVGAFLPAQIDGRLSDPVRGGCSIGNEFEANAATLGGWAHSIPENRPVLLTNNHVLTQRHNRTVVPAAAGVLQPGRHMSGATPRRIGRTLRVVPMVTDRFNHLSPPLTSVDAAIASIDVSFDHRILDLDTPAIYETASVGMAQMLAPTPVQKRGVASGLTRGRIVSTTPDIEVDFGEPGDHDFGRFPPANLFRVDGGDRPFARQGDSGALVLAQAPGRVAGTFPVLGMLLSVDFTGNEATVCRIGPVFEALHLTTLCTGAVRNVIRAVIGGD